VSAYRKSRHFKWHGLSALCSTLSSDAALSLLVCVTLRESVTMNTFGLPLRNVYAQQLWRQKLWCCRPCEFGTVCHVACEHLTSATNILKHYWRRICFDYRSRRFVTSMNAFKILVLTYLLAYQFQQLNAIPSRVTRFIAASDSAVNRTSLRRCWWMRTWLSEWDQTAAKELNTIGLWITVALHYLCEKNALVPACGAVGHILSSWMIYSLQVDRCAINNDK